MYAFEDTTIHTPASPSLPKEAVMVNGQFIENVIDGYRTLYVTGRESMAAEIETASVGSADGEKVKRVRYPARTITVGFQIIAESETDFRNKFNQLNCLLTKDEAEFIFNDETDKFFTGIPVMSVEVEGGKNAVVGEYQIYCPYPFKRSVTEYAAYPSDGVFSVNYDGTYKTYPTFEVDFPLTLDADGNNTNDSECGYVGFADARGNVLQFGDPDATDWAEIVHPATNPLNKTFKSISGWAVNNSETTATGHAQVGAMAANSSGYCYPSNYGSGSQLHGPSLSYVLTDATESKNFDFTWKQKFVGNKKQFGAFECLLWNNNNGVRTLIGAVCINKTTKNSKAKVYFYANGSKSNKYNFTVECSKIGSCSIKKQGTDEGGYSVSISVAGKTKPFALSAAIGNMIINEVTFWFGKNASKTALGTNYLYNCSLKRHAYPKDEDVENLFQAGDKLKVDCESASVTLDSGDAETNAQTIGALGNDWETFALQTGQNVIAVDFSDWVTTTPQAVMKYRKVYL